MTDPNMTEQEKQCVRILAKLFNEGTVWLSRGLETLQKHGLEADYPTFVTLMRMMEKYQAIYNISHYVGATGQFGFFHIAPEAVKMVRELDALHKQSQEPRDIVSFVSEKSRRHPVIAWIIIGILVLTALMTFVNQGCQFLITVGVIEPQKK